MGTCTANIMQFRLQLISNEIKDRRMMSHRALNEPEPESAAPCILNLVCRARRTYTKFSIVPVLDSGYSCTRSTSSGTGTEVPGTVLLLAASAG
eukprot:SAG31_NODE_155_length_22130_cov_9.540098_23_plen_94_part_00